MILFILTSVVFIIDIQMADQNQPQNDPPQQQLQDEPLPILASDNKHNICAYVDDVLDMEKFGMMLTFLRRSPIHYAITARPKIYIDIINQFWHTASYDSVNKSITATINRTQISFDNEYVQRVLRFNDNLDHPWEFDRSLVRGLLTRLHYGGDTEKSMVNKNGFSAPYKYLFHVLLHCLSGRKGGFDEGKLSIRSAFVALILNKSFSYSNLIFDHLKEQLQNDFKKRWLFYPRFLQLIINDLIPDLVVDNRATNILVQRHMDAETVNRMSTYRGVIPPTKKMIGHNVNPAYVCPPDDRWIHDDSDSEREGGEGGNDGNDGDDGGDGNGGGDRNVGAGGSTENMPLDEGSTAFQEQQQAIDSALSSAVAVGLKDNLERKRKGKKVATGESLKKKPRVSAGAGVIIGTPPVRRTLPQSSAVPLTTSTPTLTLTTTAVPHEVFGTISQQIITEIPNPPPTLSTVEPTITFPTSPTHTAYTPPPPLPMPTSIPYMRITRPQGPIQPVHPSIHNMPYAHHIEMLLGLIHFQENQMTVERQNQERMMEHQRRLIGYVSYCQKDAKALREIVTSQGVKLAEYEERFRLQDEKLKKQDELILQLTCKDDALKCLKNNDEDKDDSDLGGGEPKQAHGSSSGAGVSGGEASQPLVVYSDPSAAKPIDMIKANTIIFVDGSGQVKSIVNRDEIGVGEYIERTLNRDQISLLLELNDDELSKLEAEPDIEVMNDDDLNDDPLYGNPDYIYEDEEVVIEDVTAEEYPDLFQHTNVEQSAPVFHEDILKEAEDEVVKDDEQRVLSSAEIMDRNVDDYIQGKRRTSRVGKYIKAQRQVDQERREFADNWVRSNQMTSFKAVSKVQGDIVSWVYDGDLKCRSLRCVSTRFVRLKSL